MKRYVLACHEGAPDGPTPKSLGEQGVVRILERRVLGWSPNIGLYGAGGPGFWGFKLSATDRYPEEWLILTVWNAGDCLLFDGEKGEIVAAEFIAAHPNAGVEVFFERYLERVNEITEKVVGSKLIDARLTPNSSEILFKKGDETHRLEIPPGASGSFQSRSWQSEENQLDAWVLSEQNELWA